VFDLAVVHRGSRETTLRQAAVWTVVWTSLALAFNALVWLWQGPALGLAFFTGYLIEWSLSMDNVFVFAVVFGFFQVPKKYQYRVLFWGILGAIAMRLTFVLAGAGLLSRFDWLMYVFGAFLVFTAIKLALHTGEDVHPDRNIVLRLARRVLPVAKGDHGKSFFVREAGKLCVTPLFLVLLVIESTDVLFAIDSVPAIFGVTKDPFIVFTSNICAILGLRALYFLLAGVMDMFRYLNYGLSAVLGFVGVKMMLPLVNEHWHIPPIPSLAIILGCLTVAIVASVIAARRDARRHQSARSESLPSNHSESQT
jgi:tellurite resistance protein TerC